MGCEFAVNKACGIAKTLIAGCVFTAAMLTTGSVRADDLQNSHSIQRPVRRLATSASADVPRSQTPRRPPHPATSKHSARAQAAAGAKATARPTQRPQPDLTGRKRLGIASFYADNFAGKPMADGAPMDLEGNNAASRTLPLGTRAQVTNLETGKSATVVIEDRGPYVDGRIVDLSPATARQIGITRRKGVSKVVVAPITVPQPDGTVKLGAAAQENQPIREASAGTTASVR
jgi:rare lipoprotein A